MDISCDLYRGVVYIPTSHAIRKGFYFMHTPVEAVSAGQTERLRHALRIAVERGNPPITEAEVRELQASEEDPILQATGARTWLKLDRERAGVWNLVELDGLYQIRVDCPMKPRGWHEDKSKRVVFPEGTVVEVVITRLIEMIQERQREVAG